jgi:hypothetical protein
MDSAQLFAVGVALAALSGVRVYLTVFGVGLAGLLGWADLPPALDACSSPWVLGTCGVLALLEFGFDKIPGVDSGWDLLHTLLRVPVGAFLTAATLSPDGHLGAGALAVGAGASLFTHLLKSGTRLLINASPEPASNWTASLGEDAVVLAALPLVMAHPWLAFSLVVALLLAAFVTALLLARWLARLLRRAMSAA